MPDVISNTSPLQYLHQAGLLHLLPALVERIIVPPGVVRELEAGRAAGVDRRTSSPCRGSPFVRRRVRERSRS